MTAERWREYSSTKFAYTQQKTLTIDGRRAASMTLNFTSRYCANTRDLAVVDAGASDVRAISRPRRRRDRRRAPVGVEHRSLCCGAARRRRPAAESCGAQVRVYHGEHPIYIHAKLI